jgi:diguanylate cyclase (GGDEF)-like protein
MSHSGQSAVSASIGETNDVPTSGQLAEGSPDLDALTGLPTRPVLHRRLSAALASATPDGPQPALLTLDLDRFQEVNDSTGLATGDGVLVRVAQRIRGAVPAGSTVARISGDEFAVLLPDVRTGALIAARLVELIGRPYAVNGHAVTISVSIGLAFAPEHGEQADDILRAATIALHRAEAEGKNHWVQFEPWMQESAKARQSLETDLRAALALNRVELRKAMAIEQFEVHYQPQVAADGYTLTGFEALVRWRHPRRGLVSPIEFIPLAEEIGLIGLLGDWVMHSACQTAAAWPVPAHGRPLQVAVNVSPLQLRERRALVASVVDSLALAGLAAHRLEVEITESALMGDAKDTLRAIKDLGVALALDDFGTGYSSLSQLAHYPFDRLKIDRSFVLDLPDGAESVGRDAVQAKWMIQAIAALGRGLGMSTIAEGVETEAQAEMLRQAGVSEIQGYLISRPVPTDEVEALIARLDAQYARTTHIFAETGHAHTALQPGVFQSEQH